MRKMHYYLLVGGLALTGIVTTVAALELKKELDYRACTSFQVVDTAKQTTHLYKRERACAWESGEYKVEKR